MKSARRRSREFAMQGLYQWQVNAGEPAAIAADLMQTKGFADADEKHFRALLQGTTEQAEHLRAALGPCLDRPMEGLSPVEHAILLVGAYEMTHHVEIPYRVVINEAVELAKTFGGTDGFKFVNGVLDKLALVLRAHEAAEHRAAPKETVKRKPGAGHKAAPVVLAKAKSKLTDA
jgi:transcription antitermination protein NusB